MSAVDRIRLLQRQRDRAAKAMDYTYAINDPDAMYRVMNRFLLPRTERLYSAIAPILRWAAVPRADLPMWRGDQWWSEAADRAAVTATQQEGGDS